MSPSRSKLSADNKNARIAFFLFLNFAMIAPMVHLFYQHGYDKASKFIGQLLHRHLGTKADDQHHLV